MSTRVSSDPPLAGLRATISLYQAKGLLAKDRNMFGKKTSSDPYVKVFYKDVLIGKTQVKKKTLDPQWNCAFKYMIGCDDAEKLKHAAPSASGLGPKFRLVLFDKDNLSADDPLGQVYIPINVNGIKQQWFSLQTGKEGEEYYCKKAKGEIQVSIEITTLLLPDVVRGNVVPLTIPGKKKLLKVGLGWNVTQRQRPIDLDVSCVALVSCWTQMILFKKCMRNTSVFSQFVFYLPFASQDTTGKVSMEETVYFSNLVNPNGSIKHSGDEREGMQTLTGENDDREQIVMDMDRLPDHIVAYVLLVTVATPGVDFSQITSARVRISSGASGVGLCAFRPAYEGENTALFCMRISRSFKKGKFGKAWSLSTIGDVNPSARDFGSLIPEIKGYCRDLFPNLDIDPNERVAVMNKETTIRIKDYAPTRDKLPSVLAMGLAWNVTNGVDIDLDASAICLDKNFNLVDLVYFTNLRSRDGAIHHSGDEREGDEIGDDEKIIVAFNAVNPRVDHIVFVINSYSEQELDDVAMASCHLFDPVTRKDLATYTMTNNASLDNHTALLLADLYRDAVSRDWMMRIISYPHQGKTAKRSFGVIVEYLRRHMPAVPAIPPNPDIITTEMPVAVALESDVCFVPEDEEICVTAYVER
jgi:tellurium resistance protein TerZ